jgi:putative hydrolase of the HAD superfamily
VEVRAVLFDLDDTLFDHSAACRAALDSLGLGHLEPEYLRLLTEGHHRVLAGEISFPEARIERFRLLCPGTTRDEACELGRRYSAHYRASRQPVPGALELLAELRPRVSIGIVTNNKVAEQEEKVGFLGLGPFIDELVVSEEVGVAKPDPGIFRAALERLEVEAREAVMVGDSWESDVMGAVAAGIPAVWLNRRGEPVPDPGMARVTRSLDPGTCSILRTLFADPSS